VAPPVFPTQSAVEQPLPIRFSSFRVKQLPDFKGENEREWKDFFRTADSTFRLYANNGNLVNDKVDFCSLHLKGKAKTRWFAHFEKLSVD